MHVRWPADAQPVRGPVKAIAMAVGFDARSSDDCAGLQYNSTNTPKVCTYRDAGMVSQCVPVTSSVYRYVGCFNDLHVPHARRLPYSLTLLRRRS